LIAGLAIEAGAHAKRIKEENVIAVTTTTWFAVVAIVAEVSRKPRARVRLTVRALV
jgi:hypothetical protein